MGMIALSRKSTDASQHTQVEFTDFKIYGKSVTPDTISSPLNKNMKRQMKYT